MAANKLSDLGETNGRQEWNKIKTQRYEQWIQQKNTECVYIFFTGKTKQNALRRDLDMVN